MIAGGIDYSEKGSGPPVICLHGIGGGAASFRDMMEGLSGYRVIAWNMPGYGNSVSSEWPPTFASLSNALGKFIEDLGLERAHLVGQSIGGMIALDHALRRPDQVSTLSLIGTTPAFGGRDDSFKDAFLKARLSGLDAGLSMKEMATETAPRLMSAAAGADQINDVGNILAAVPEKAWRGILECLVTFNRREDLGRVSQPCCLIAGGEDQNAPARTMERMAEKLPKSEYHLIEDAGHMINQEAPKQTNSIVQDFLERHPL